MQNYTHGDVETITLTETGAGDTLIAVETTVADVASVHETIDDHGIMRMRSIGAVVLESGKPVTMQPGGRHIMLMGLKAPLKVGDRFNLTLKFEHAAPMTVTVLVEPLGVAPVGAMPGMTGNGDHMH